MNSEQRCGRGRRALRERGADGQRGAWRGAVQSLMHNQPPAPSFAEPKEGEEVAGESVSAGKVGYVNGLGGVSRWLLIRWCVVLSTAVCGVVVGEAGGADGRVEEQGPVERVEAEKKKTSPTPTLDELLGVEVEGQTAKEGAAGKQSDEAGAGVSAGAGGSEDGELDKLLTGKQLSDAFGQAISMMGDASRRLGVKEGEKRDAGLETQRVQEDVIKKLEQVLESLQQQGGSSSSKSKGSKRDAQNQQPQSTQKQKSQQGQQPSGSENSGQVNAPGLEEGKLGPRVEGAKSAWGALPQRVRDMLLQGAGDKFSAKYQKMTEAYYRKLAEEKEGK